MMKSVPNDLETVVWTFSEYFLTFFSSFYLLTLIFVMLRPVRL